MEQAKQSYMNGLALVEAQDFAGAATEFEATGNPYFSTDTAAALRAMEIRASALFKATKVDGVYDHDPVRHPDAKLLPQVSYDSFLTQQLGVMDATAVALCRDNGLPIRVFKMARDNIRKVCLGEHVGTVVSQ